MGKKGQAEVIRFFIIAIIIVAITLFGYKSFTAIQDRICTAEIVKFQTDLKNLDRIVDYGSIKKFSKQIPCQVDEIYFFDLNKKINLDILDNQPLLKDSIESNERKNIFLMKDDKIMDSFYAGNLNINFPNYICLLPKFEKINF